MTKEETIYTVWCGEYSDRSMVAIFHSKEKAEKYADVHSNVSANNFLYENYYVVEYTFSDNNFDISSEVSKMYYCTICLEDGLVISSDKKGDIITDKLWEDLMKEVQIDSYDDLIPENYNKDADDLYNLETDFGCSVEFIICTNDIDIKMSDTCWDSKYITVYSKKSYAHARKIAIEQFQIYTQQKLENGEI